MAEQANNSDGNNTQNGKGPASSQPTPAVRHALVASLARLAGQFDAAAAASGDLYFSEVRLPAAPLRDEDGQIDLYVLERVRAAMVAGRDVVGDMAWDQPMPEQEDQTSWCELWLARDGRAPGIDLLTDLCESAVRLVLAVPEAAAAMGLEPLEPDSVEPDWAGAWTRAVIELAATGALPAMVAAAGRIEPDDVVIRGGVGFRLGYRTADLAADRRGSVARLTAAARAGAQWWELRTGLLRSSAHVLDWIRRVTQ